MNILCSNTSSLWNLGFFLIRKSLYYSMIKILFFWWNLTSCRTTDKCLNKCISYASETFRFTKCVRRIWYIFCAIQFKLDINSWNIFMILICFTRTYLYHVDRFLVKVSPYHYEWYQYYVILTSFLQTFWSKTLMMYTVT